MTHFFEKLKREAESVHLSAERQQDIRTRLIQAMRERPVLVTRHQWRSLRWVQFAAVCLVLVFAAGATTSYAANQALPGDFLYSVKVNVNEPVQAALKRTPEAKAAWEIEQASRRLEEVDALSLSNKLNPATQAVAQRGLDVQIQRANAEIEKVESRGNSNKAIELHTHLSAVLSAHEEILDSLERRHGDDRRELETTRRNVRSTLNDAAEKQKKNDRKEETVERDRDNESKSSSSGQESRDNRSRQIAREILDRAAQALASLSELNTFNAGRLDVARDFLTEAQRAYDAGNYEVSLARAKRALQAVQEIRIFKGVEDRLHLEVESRSGRGGGDSDEDSSGHSGNNSESSRSDD